MYIYCIYCQISIYCIKDLKGFTIVTNTDLLPRILMKMT